MSVAGLRVFGLLPLLVANDSVRRASRPQSEWENTMRVTLHAPIVLEFRSPWSREVAYLLLTAARSAVISYYVWVAFAYPVTNLPWLRECLVLLARVLAVPILIFGKLIPPLASSLFESHNPNPRLQDHLIAGIATYVFLFHLPVLVRVLRQYLSRERA